MKRTALAVSAVAVLSSAAPVLAGPGLSFDPFGSFAIQRSSVETDANKRFTDADKNCDDALSPQELELALPRKPDPRRVRLMDANGDGRISRDEFVGALMRRFDKADANHDGRLTMAERRALIESRKAGGGGN